MSDETISQPRIKATWLLGTLVAFVLFVIIGAYSKRMSNDYPSYDSQRAAIRYQNLATVNAAEAKLLEPVDQDGHTTAEWVDEKKGIIRIPIEQAMSEEVDALQGKAPAMGNALPVANPAPAPAPASAPGAKTPAPAAAASNATNKPAAANKKPAAPATTTNH